jgi:oligoribonuclease
MKDNPGMIDSPPALPRSDRNLVWLDCEMSGLDPDKERLLEIAVIVTGPGSGAPHRGALCW